MSITPKRLIDPVQLPSAAAAIYTSTNVKTILKKATLCNTTGVNRTVTIYIVPAGGSAGATNTVLQAIPVLAGATVEVYDIEGHVLNAGDALWGLADAASAVTFHLSGMEVA